MSCILANFSRFDKRAKNGPLFGFRNLLQAYRDCRRNKRRTLNAARFEFDFEKNLLKLEKELREKTYRPKRSICFVVTEPKIREIFAADFRDRVVHHLLVGHLAPFFEPRFIFHSWACRKEKGAVRALLHLKKSLRKTARGSEAPVFFLKIDIQSFFMSIDKKILFEIIRRRTKNSEIIWLAEKVVFHDPTQEFFKKGQLNLFDRVPEGKSLFKVPPGKGLPIGNYTSQFFANVYLNELDQFAKHILKIRHWFRYVDDIVMLHENSEQLKIWRREINDFLRKKLALSLHPKKDVLQPISRGIDFLGYVVKPRSVLARNRTVRKLKGRLWQWNKNLSENKAVPPAEKMERILSSINSYYGLFRHADTFRLRKHLFEKHFGILQKYFEPSDDNFSYFKLLELNSRRNRVPISGGHSAHSW